MDAKLQRRVQRYGWDKAEPHYERYWQAQLAPARDRLLAMAALAARERVLDVACGTGLVTFPAAEAVGGGGSVSAVDISAAMTERVTADAARRSLTQVQAARMEAEALDFPDGQFDVALCALGLMYVPDPPRAVREMRRVLRDGGRVVASVWGARARCGWADIFPIVESRVASDVCPMFFGLGAGETLASTMAAAGFADVRTERVTTTLEYDSAEAACGAAFAGGPVALAYSRFDAAMRDEAHAEYLASIQRYQHGGGYAIPGEFVIARGRK
jgi:SAM-dependent methyltransferase